MTENLGYIRRAFDIENEAPDEVKDYKHVAIHKDSILLSGDATFYTLQGEGPTLGIPCVFIRLHQCNLQCSWCDAFYTWNKESLEFWTESSRASFEDCARYIEETWRGPDTLDKTVVWTGGEPLMQRNQIDRVMAILCDWNYEIETNGTLMPTPNQIHHAQFNCSPKLRNSDNIAGSMVKPKILAVLNQANTTFKFVCIDERDLDEIEQSYVPHIDERKIIIMPEGVTEEEVSTHAKQLIEPCKARGWRMTPRFQNIFAHGAQRGV